jgi:hypothetical protein
MESNNIVPMQVTCLSERPGIPDQVREGNSYLIDRMSIWIDSDGDAYGVVYDMNHRRIGHMRLKHFMTTIMNA